MTFDSGLRKLEIGRLAIIWGSVCKHVIVLHVIERACLYAWRVLHACRSDVRAKLNFITLSD